MASQQKFGRNKRSPSCKQQVYRSAANKERRIKREKARQSQPKQMKVPRGTMRRYKRQSLPTPTSLAQSD
jgi:hypothetical protein